MFMFDTGSIRVMFSFYFILCHREASGILDISLFAALYYNFKLENP